MMILSHYEYHNIDRWWMVNISDEIEVLKMVNTFMNHNSNMTGITAEYNYSGIICDKRKIHALISNDKLERLKRDFNNYPYEYIKVIQESIIFAFQKWEQTEPEKRKQLIVF